MSTKNTANIKAVAKDTGKGKRSKKDLKEILTDMSDPAKVLASPDIITASDLLHISYELGEYPYPEKISTKDYENEKQMLQAELLKVQVWVKEEQKRIIGFFDSTAHIQSST